MIPLNASGVAMPADHLRPALARRDTRATVIRLPSATVRLINVRAFNELCELVHSRHGELPELQEPQFRAAVAMRRFPVPVLGPGLRRTLGEMDGAADAFRNVLEVFVEADRSLRRGRCIDTADAIVHAFARLKSENLVLTRERLLQTSRDCEFFAPELVLLLAALQYD